MKFLSKTQKLLETAAFLGTDGNRKHLCILFLCLTGKLIATTRAGTPWRSHATVASSRVKTLLLADRVLCHPKITIQEVIKTICILVAIQIIKSLIISHTLKFCYLKNHQCQVTDHSILHAADCCFIVFYIYCIVYLSYILNFSLLLLLLLAFCINSTHMLFVMYIFAVLKAYLSLSIYLSIYLSVC